MTDLLPTSDSSLPLSVRAVDKAAGMLAGAGSTRRRFLYRLAVIGSALAIDPLRFITRPTPAYASVCGSGRGCDAGWSVFCCTINNGANTCPSGSFVAGWWKVDASAFCLGSARYYIDCNRKPNASCRCRCNSTGCDDRRVCCNVFRYGQCNTQVAGVTEVVCRLITCTPPWKWDPACSATVRIDEKTRSHSAACLPRKNASRITLKYQDLGLVGSVLGRPQSSERDAARGGRKRRYEKGRILWHRTTGAHEVHGPIAGRFLKMKAETGPLGYPTTDQRAVGDGAGTFNRFENGSVYHRSSIGARAVLRRADERYRKLRGPTGPLGYPKSNTRSVEGGGKVTNFERGAIFMSADTNAIEVTGQILQVYRARGGPSGSGLGFPIQTKSSADSGRLQRFERGMIAGATGRNVFALHGPIYDRFARQDGVTGPWGYPTSSTDPVPGATHGMESTFQGGTGYWSPASPKAHWLDGPILRSYRDEGGPAGYLGYPKTDVRTNAQTQERYTDFERGRIVYDPATDRTRVEPTVPA